MEELLSIGQKAKNAAYTLADIPTAAKNDALAAIANALSVNKDRILYANSQDVLRAKMSGMNESLIDRLTLTSQRIDGIVRSVNEVIALPDPVGEILGMNDRPSGIKVGKMRVPIGVIAIIYEARPNVTVDAACLTLKSGNAVILRGGKEAIETNVTLAEIMREAVKSAGVCEDVISIIKDTSRQTATELMKLKDYVDLLIPRGSAALIKATVENATVPVIETAAGNCHIYIDDSADINMGAEILFNAKTSRPSVCNAAESLLVSRSVADRFLPLAAKVLSEKNVEIRGCEETASIINCKTATDEDYYAEYLDYIISCKVVSGIDEAIEHINKHSTGHSEAIITNNYENAQKFLRRVDSAAVYVNASTRFTDGNEFGFGAEIGISTQKLHARGPMGLSELTTVKYIVLGNGQIR